ncbi:MAG: DUF2845 domain-containing protein [Legionella sp.]|nr:DUF2845 domain-containing protein [Legionella sp.]
MVYRWISSFTAALLIIVPLPAMAEDTIYCPQNHAYIRLGMTTNEVISACGQPLKKQESNRPLMRKIPVLQLIYNAQGSQNAFYGVWSLPVGVNSGVQLEVEVTNDKVSSVQLNGSSTQAITICGGNMIQIGDPVNKVYSYCGSPSLANNTYINQPIPSEEMPQIWTYQVDAYQPPYTLTFLNGHLQEIN